ncbi:hypothetical protein ACJJTC_000706 [Scirpophaga incertulas]
MSDSVKPDSVSTSYGGHFNVLTKNVNTDNHSNESGSTNQIGIKKSSIPSNFRFWEAVGKKTTTGGDASNNFKFTVLSYNVLAQYLLECHPYLYTECSPTNLKWKIRSARIFDEIISISPDIICLQEVQATHLNTFYSQFDAMGYCGIFKQKTGHRIDGCAIYFKKSLFKIEDHFSVEFYQPELPILNRDNIGVMVKLVPHSMPNSPVVVATTHLLYNPKRTDVRLAQIQVLLAEIDRFAFYQNGNLTGHLPIILTGDLNSTPDSAVIKLLDKGRVRASPFRDSSDWQRIGVTDNCQHLSVFLDRQEGRVTDFSNIKIQNSDYHYDMNEPIASCSRTDTALHEALYSELFNSGVIGHNLQLISTYDKIKSDGSVEASTFQDYWVTVDYIYFSRLSGLNLLERLRLPTAEECQVLGVLPNEVFGSDHLALAASFELRPQKANL